MKNHILLTLISLFITVLYLSIATSSVVIARSIDAMQRMTTNYHGVTHKGSLKILYGTNGAISYTDDDFVHIRRINIGDGEDIIFIDSTSAGFAGCTRHKIVSSVDGLTWTLKSADSIIDATLRDDTLYVLTPTHLVIYRPIGSLEVVTSKQLDPLYTPAHIAVDDVNIYVSVDRWYVATFVKSSLAASNQLVVNFPFVNTNATSISAIKCTQNAVFVQTKTALLSNFYTSIILKSTDHGKHWLLTTHGLSNGDCTLMMNDSIYCISTTSYSMQDLESYLRLDYVKIDSSHVAKDSLEYTRINERDTIPSRFIFNNNYFGQIFHQIRHVGGANLLAVGEGSVIAFSNDLGVTWSYHSIFKVQYTGREQMQVLDSNHILFYDGPIAYSTTDGGISWLPPKYFHCPQLNRARLEAFRNDKSGNGVIKFDSYDAAAYNILSTQDFWRTCKIVSRDSLFYLSDSGLSKTIYFSVNPEVISFDGKFIQLSNVSRNESNQTVIKSYLVVNDSMLVTTSVTPMKDSTRAICLARMDNGDTYALCLSERGLNSADSLGRSSTYSYFYYIAKLKSDFTWEVVVDRAPMYQNLTKNGNKYRYVNIIDIACVIRGQYVFFRNGFNIVYRYNTDSGVVDSLEMPCKYFSLLNNGIDVDSTRIICVGFNQKLYFSSYESPSKWDSTDISTFLPGWSPYNFISNPIGIDLTGRVQVLTKARAYIQSISAFGGLAGYRWVGLIRYDRTSNINPVDVDVQSPLFLYCSPVYPHPASGIVSSTVSWDRGYSKEELSLQFLDIVGQQVASGRMSSIQLDDHSVRVTCDLTGISRGLYILKATLRQSSYHRLFIVD